MKIIEATIDRKLALAKLQSQIVETDKKETNSETSDNSLSDEDKNLLRDLFNEKKEKNNTDYELD